MTEVASQLLQRDSGLALLFAPPFDKTPLDPGYIKGYPPGIRENGGQYTHAATWSVIAFTMLNEARQAVELFSSLNPINRTATRANLHRYKVEPYVVAADVYSMMPHTGRGGWTWYTGSAGWMYRAALESILGFRLQGDRLRIAPCIPEAWAGFEITFRYRTARYEIKVENRMVDGGATGIELDGAALPAHSLIRLVDDGKTHLIRLLLDTAATGVR
jgi:cyclic beta-1,2-glucan synthetase